MGGVGGSEHMLFFRCRGPKLQEDFVVCVGVNLRSSPKKTLLYRIR